jgi:general secretion pathway protein C
MGRLGIRIANVALFTLCCFQVASVVNDVSADLLMPGPSSFASGVEPAPVVQRSWSERTPILERNLFGAQIFASAEPAPVPQEDLEATKLPLKLLGTQVSSIREHSKAAIADSAGRDPEVLHEGDPFAKHPQARLVRIERRRVILQNGNQREELLLDEEGTAPPPPPLRTAARRASRRSVASRRPEPTPLTERLRALQLDQNEGRDARSLFNQAKIIPHWEDGQMIGMELQEIEPGSLYEKVGLKAGDVITSFNGVDLDSAAAGARVLSQFVEADEFNIKTLDGTVLTVGPDELPGLLGDDQ